MTPPSGSHHQSSSYLVSDIDNERLVAFIESMGWTAWLAGPDQGPSIHAVADGVNFEVRLGSRIAGEPAWSDFTLSAVFDIDREVSPIVAASWNRRWRYVRAFRIGEHLFVERDIVVAGGVTTHSLRYQFRAWAHALRLFISHLEEDRERLVRLNARKAAQALHSAPAWEASSLAGHAAVAPGGEAGEAMIPSFEGDAR